MDNTISDVNHGKPWTNSFVCKSFQDADDKRNKILKENSEQFQVKVKRRSDGTFVVKTRNMSQEKTSTKNKKNKKNKKNSVVSE